MKKTSGFNSHHLHQKKIKKPLDKQSQVWYNKYVSKREKSPLNKKPCPTKRLKNLVGKLIKVGNRCQKGIDTMTNTNVKMTQRAALTYAIENLPDAPADVVEKLNAMLTALDKKNSAERKPTAKQVENANFKADILAWMEPDATYVSADIVKGVPSIVDANISAQRVSAMLTQLVNDGALIREIDKRKSVYRLA